MSKITARSVVAVLAVGLVFTGVQVAVAGQARVPAPTVVTLADGLAIGSGQVVELAPVDVSAYESLSFLGSAASSDFVTIWFGFSDATGALGSVPAFMVGQCQITNLLGTNAVPPMIVIGACYPNGGGGNPDGVFRTAGPFLRVLVVSSQGANTVTLKALLVKRR